MPTSSTITRRKYLLMTVNPAQCVNTAVVGDIHSVRLLFMAVECIVVRYVIPYTVHEVQLESLPCARIKMELWMSDYREYWQVVPDTPR